MLTYKEALAIAREQKTKINYCTEYSDAYAFGYHTGSGVSKGGDNPIVVMKEDGQTLNFTAYAATPGKEYLRDFDVFPPQNTGLTDAELERLEAEHPYSRWSTPPDVTHTISEPTPEQRKLAEEINAQRAAAARSSLNKA